MFKRLRKALLKNSTKPSMIELTEQTPRFPGGLCSIQEIQSTDVVVVGFPKSGNTLMQHILAHLYYGVNGECSRTMVNLIAPDIYSNSHYFRFNNVCFFKSHNLPQENYRNVIYIMRDGRDALLSYYHMVKDTKQHVSLEDLYKGKVKLFNSLWCEHVEEWEKNPFGSRILWMKYEDLQQNKLGELRRMCEFLNIIRTKEELEKVCEYTSFAHMKTLENREDWNRIKSRNISKGKSFVRKGAVKGYIEEVNPELIHFFEQQSASVLEKYYVR